MLIINILYTRDIFSIDQVTSTILCQSIGIQHNDDKCN